MNLDNAAEEQLRRIDALIAEKIDGINLVPPLAYRMARAGWRHISLTGDVFVLHDGTRIPMPPGESITQPEGSDYWNDRYAWYVAKQLGDKIKDEVDAVRYEPPHYTEMLHLAHAALTKTTEDFVYVFHRLQGGGLQHEVYSGFGSLEDGIADARSEKASFLAMAGAALVYAGLREEAEKILAP